MFDKDLKKYVMAAGKRFRNVFRMTFFVANSFGIKKNRTDDSSDITNTSMCSGNSRSTCKQNDFFFSLHKTQ